MRRDMRKPRKEISKKPSSDQEAAIFAAELGACPALDLHGHDILTAEREIDAFIDQAFMRREHVVKMIHGRGTQKLQRAVEDCLTRHPLVDAFRPSQHPAESNAVTYAVLGRK